MRHTASTIERWTLSCRAIPERPPTRSHADRKKSMGSDIPNMLAAVAVSGNTEAIDIAGSLPAMAYDRYADAARLKAIFDKVVKKRGESRDDFGRRTGLGKAANVGHYLTGVNKLDVESARKFAAGIPCRIEDFSPHWARIAKASGQVALSEKVDPPEHGGIGHSDNAGGSGKGALFGNDSGPNIKLPLIHWRQVGLMTEDNHCLIGIDGVEFVESDGESVTAKTKYILMPDDSMSPRIEQGDRLTVEPGWVPEPGEIAVVKDADDVYYVRRIKQVTPARFVAEPINQTDYMALDSVEFGLTAVGVVVARREFLAKRRR